MASPRVRRWRGARAATLNVVGDYDGDGKADLALFTPSGWTILLSGCNYTTSMSTSWGLTSDVRCRPDADPAFQYSAVPSVSGRPEGLHYTIGGVPAGGAVDA